MSTDRPYRWFLPVWFWIFLVLVVGYMVWIRVGADLGDAGFANILTMLGTIVALLIGTIWFLFFSRFRRSVRFLSVGAAVVALVVFGFLFEVKGVRGSMVPILGLRSAGGAPLASAVGTPGIDLAKTTAQDFPGFLGPSRDLTVPDLRLARDWKTHPPEPIWKQPIGAGWSAFAVVNGVAVTMEQREGSETVSAYDLLTGELHWAHSWPGAFAHPLGGPGPRSTPLIDGGRVYALGAAGHLVCLDGATGDVIWEKDLLQEFGLNGEDEFVLVQYGRSNSPLVVGDLLVVPGGGRPDRPPASLVAYDKRTGEKIWEATGNQISFSSPRLATLAGTEQILILNESTANGYDPITGDRLWEHPWPGRTAANATSSQAVPVPPDRVFMSKGYGEGAALIQLVPRGDGSFDTRELWHNNRVLRTKFTNVAIIDGHAYGLSDGILECVRLDTGERVWKRGRYGHGQILRVGEPLLIQSEDGEIVHLDPSPERPDDVIGRFQAIHGKSWANLALYGPYLAIRNSTEAAVYRLPLAG